MITIGGKVVDMHAYVKITHNLNPGDSVRAPGRKTMAKVIELNPMNHWPNCVIVNPPLNGWKHWDAHELEKVK